MKSIFLILFFITLFVYSQAERQEEDLEDGKYFFGWDYNQENDEIIFDVKVKTLGWVGFGISDKRSMQGADIVIGGVKDDGEQYFDDYHAVNFSTPILDEIQNWKLLHADEDGEFTYLKFSRVLSTCDKDDYLINFDTLSVIYAYGETDEINYHGPTRGGHQFTFLDPPSHSDELKDLHPWEVRVNDTLPSEDTIYLCSVHKIPTFAEKIHLMALDAHLPDTNSLQHTHHFTAFICDSSESRPDFEEIEKTSFDCLDMEILKIRNKCLTVFFGWAVGGKLTILPEHVGIPIGGPHDARDYVLLEIHYDNPQKLANVPVITGFDAYFTTKIRENDGAIMIVGQKIYPTLLIPPDSEDYKMVGHCSSEITKKFIPEDGINIVAVNMHSHLSGRKMRFRHFRGNEELPWIANDENYDFDFQQTRMLKNEIKVLPGDHLTVECTFDTKWKNNSRETTIAGDSSWDEMCHAFLFYYPEIVLRACRSCFPVQKMFNMMGIHNYSRLSDVKNPILTEPEEFRGLTFKQFLEDFRWNSTFKSIINNILNYQEHEAFYIEQDVIGNPSTRFFDETQVNNTKYPIIKEAYQPPPLKCNADSIGHFKIVPILITIFFCFY